MDRMHRGVFETPAARFAQVTDLTNRQRQFMKAVKVAAAPSSAYGQPTRHCTALNCG
jgi:hypothetical protein